jgi:hypothetical protein
MVVASLVMCTIEWFILVTCNVEFLIISRRILMLCILWTMGESGQCFFFFFFYFWSTDITLFSLQKWQVTYYIKGTGRRTLITKFKSQLGNKRKMPGAFFHPWTITNFTLSKCGSLDVSQLYAPPGSVTGIDEFSILHGPRIGRMTCMSAILVQNLKTKSSLLSVEILSVFDYRYSMRQNIPYWNSHSSFHFSTVYFGAYCKIAGNVQWMFIYCLCIIRNAINRSDMVSVTRKGKVVPVLN